MSILSKLFGGSAAKTAADPVIYKGFRILPQPIAEGGQFRISAVIEKGTGDDVQSHTMIRADTLNGMQAATDASTGKAKQMIDEQGDQLFAISGRS